MVWSEIGDYVCEGLARGVPKCPGIYGVKSGLSAHQSGLAGTLYFLAQSPTPKALVLPDFFDSRNVRGNNVFIKPIARMLQSSVSRNSSG